MRTAGVADRFRRGEHSTVSSEACSSARSRTAIWRPRANRRSPPRYMRPNCSCLSRGCHLSLRDDAHAILTSHVDPLTIVLVAVALALGALIGWLAARPATARLQTALDKERTAHAEQLKTWQRAEQSFRDAFSSLSAKALSQNNEAFLQLAETKFRQARTEATADVDARKKAIEDLLSPMAKTLERVDAEVRDAEKRRLQDTGSLLERVARLDANSR